MIVDDGSKDETPAILAEYAGPDALHPGGEAGRPRQPGRWAAASSTPSTRATTPLDPVAFDYVCKLDLDLDLPPGYFAGLMDRMESEPRIGTCSGKPYFFPPGATDDPSASPSTDMTGLVSEKTGDENSVGMTKFYRTACFRQIGGFVREVMWDGIDGHRCRQLGWIAISWDDPSCASSTCAPMGTSHKNWWTGRTRHGFGQYFMGTAPIVHAGQRRLPDDAAATGVGRPGDGRGLLQEHAQGARATATPSSADFLRATSGPACSRASTGPRPS